MLIITAYQKTNYLISYIDGLFPKILPGADAPNVIDIWFANTAVNIIFGTNAWLNQFTATFTAEFNTNKFPNAAKNDPNNKNTA